MMCIRAPVFSLVYISAKDTSATACKRVSTRLWKGHMIPCAVSRNILTPDIIGAKSCEKSKRFLQLLVGNLPLKRLLLAHYEARKVQISTGLAECGGVIENYLLGNGKQQEHP